MNFEINLSFLIELFSYLTKNSRQNFKYLETEKNFEHVIKMIFKELSAARNCLRPNSAPLRNNLRTKLITTDLLVL